jgi:hypothetical protein
MPVMISNSFTYRLAVLTVLAGGILAVSHVGGSARQAQDDPLVEAPASEAPRLDEMAWVDPIVTGPVSPAYRRLREEAGCETAAWPNIPDVCFPK